MIFSRALPCCTFSAVNHLILSQTFAHTHTHLLTHSLTVWQNCSSHTHSAICTFSAMHFSFLVSAHTLNIKISNTMSVNLHVCIAHCASPPLPILQSSVFCLPLNYSVLLAYAHYKSARARMVVVLFTQEYTYYNNIEYKVSQ